MDVRNGKAIKTLIRNKLNNGAEREETLLWFREKGVSVENFKSYVLLKSVENVAKSEISEFCNSIVYRDAELCCYHGPKIKSTTLEALKESPQFIWNEETVFTQYLEGKKCYMFWDNVDKKWVFSDDKKVESSYKKLVESKIGNIMGLEPSFTYTFVIVENRGEHNGVYLETVHSTNQCKELSWQESYDISIKAELKHPDVYKFEGFESLEPSDFPLYAIDKSKNIFLLGSIK